MVCNYHSSSNGQVCNTVRELSSSVSAVNITGFSLNVTVNSKQNSPQLMFSRWWQTPRRLGTWPGRWTWWTAIGTRGGRKKPKVGILIGSRCFPILICLNKHHVNLCCPTWMVSACPGGPFPAKIYKGFPKFIKEKYSCMYFLFLPLKSILSQNRL